MGIILFFLGACDVLGDSLCARASRDFAANHDCGGDCERSWHGNGDAGWHGRLRRAFIAAMVATGVDIYTATITVIVTRVFVLIGTIVSGYGFYQHALMSREDKFEVSKD